MLQDITQAKALDNAHLWIRFEDGVEGEVDVSQITRFQGVFASLRDPRMFAQVQVNPELGTVVWPGGADLAPDVLYELITGHP